MGRLNLSAGRKRKWALAILFVLFGASLGLGLLHYRSDASSLSEQNLRQPVLEALTRYANSKFIDVSAVYAAEDFFRLTGSDPRELGVDPQANFVFLVMADTHIGTLPDYQEWARSSELWAGEVKYSILSYKLLQDSEHHHTVILQFPRRDSSGKYIPEHNASSFRLVVRGLEGRSDEREMVWNLPLALPHARMPAFPFLTLLPMLAGLLVVFAPCAVHMSAYYLGLMGGAGAEGGSSLRAVSYRGNSVVMSALFFVLGFVLLYTGLGTMVGYAGQFLSKDPSFSALTRILTIVSGSIIIYFGFQVSGLFRMPFLLRFRLPYIGVRTPGTSYTASFFSGLAVATGCLQCVGGALFASMLLYAGSLGSPIQGGLTLMAFSLGIGVPYVLGALAYSRWGTRLTLPLKITRYVPLASGIVMISLGMIMLSGLEGALEGLIFQVLRLQGA